MEVDAFIVEFPSGGDRRMDVRPVHARVERGVVKFPDSEGTFICVRRGLSLSLAMHELRVVFAGLAAKLRLLVASPFDLLTLRRLFLVHEGGCGVDIFDFVSLQ